MALQGTITDFGLADILQLIGIQRKTGVLTLEKAGESVTIKFLDGQIVGADTKRATVEELLGSVLVRTGRLTEGQLREALRIQRRTLQRLGHVLVKNGLISADDLIEALRVQSLQIIYRLFRWRDGHYHFRTSESVEYDDQHFEPISSETILMEGARMVDEWPIIERRIRSDRIVFRHTDLARRALSLSVDTIVDRDIAPLGDGDGVPALSIDERTVLDLADGARTVAEISDRSALGEFDTFSVLADLVSRGLLEEERKGRKAPKISLPEHRWTSRAFRSLLHLILLVPVLGGLLTLAYNPFSPWRIGVPERAGTELRQFASLARLERIDRAVRVFYLDAGSFPARLEHLAQGAYLDAADLVDPWGRAYGWRLSSGGYEMFGRGADGEPDPDLRISRRIGAAQRLLTGSGAAR